MATADDVKLKPGYRVDGRWQVVRKLGQGAFGAVYEAIDGQGKVKGSKALKLESVKSRDQVLKIEVAVLRALVGTNHVCQLVACGRNDRFNFMLMSLLGPSLANLRKRQLPDQKFTITTTVNLTLQCLTALSDMHNVGWLHRDVKPSNFAMGPRGDPETSRTAFALDFGLSRNYSNNGILRAPREAVGFRGTLRYCSMNGHHGKELGRQDDLLSLLYMFHEMRKGSLPWKTMNSNHEVMASKEQTVNEVYEDLPPKFLSLHEYLHSIKYEDKPEYARFEEILFELVTAKQMSETPMDWEIKKPKAEQDLDSKVTASEIPNFEITPNFDGGANNTQPDDNKDVADLPKSHYRELVAKKKPE